MNKIKPKELKEFAVSIVLVVGIMGLMNPYMQFPFLNMELSIILSAILTASAGSLAVYMLVNQWKQNQKYFYIQKLVLPSFLICIYFIVRLIKPEILAHNVTAGVNVFVSTLFILLSLVAMIYFVVEGWQLKKYKQ
jgi:UDP-N-acetylmuramyl pentapeptide phosphotransferase/UDP-N-acetylglucosamine-1-phosphate transferase